MNGFIDTPTFLRKIDTTKEQMNENQIIKLKDVRDLVVNETKKYYHLLDIVLNYIDLLLKADENGCINKRVELNSKLKTNIQFLSNWEFLVDGDIL